MTFVSVEIRLDFYQMFQNVTKIQNLLMINNSFHSPMHISLTNVCSNHSKGSTLNICLTTAQFSCNKNSFFFIAFIMSFFSCKTIVSPNELSSWENWSLPHKSQLSQHCSNCLSTLQNQRIASR